MRAKIPVAVVLVRTRRIEADNVAQVVGAHFFPASGLQMRYYRAAVGVHERCRNLVILRRFYVRFFAAGAAGGKKGHDTEQNGGYKTVHRQIVRRLRT